MSDKNLQIVQSWGGNNSSNLGKIGKKHQYNRILSNRFFNSFRYFYGKFFNGLNWFCKSRSGAILIEFAFSVPVFLALIYYVHDPCKVKRYRRKMQFVANQVVQIIQNISQNRTNPRITRSDIAQAVRMAYLTIFPGVSMVPTKDTYLPLGYYIEFYMHYVVGTSGGNASVKWRLQVYWTGDLISVNAQNVSDHNALVNWKTNVPPQQIYKGFTSIKEGEAKIIVECHLRYGTNMHFSDNRSLSNVSPKELFGFLLYSPKCDTGNGSWRSFFINVAIFTPRVGLFSNDPPS